MPLMASSSGLVTALSTLVAFAPMYDALTVTSGGATLGYCAMGSAGIAIRPASKKTTDATAASIGRRRKKRVTRSLLGDDCEPTGGHGVTASSRSDMEPR